jgi:hypothetical protein
MFHRSKLAASEAEIANRLRSRTLGQRVVIVLRRAVGLLLAIALQVAAAYAIVFVRRLATPRRQWRTWRICARSATAAAPYGQIRLTAAASRMRS